MSERGSLNKRVISALNEKKELTREEKEHIYSRASIPMLLFFSVSLAYMTFLSDIPLMDSMLDAMNYAYLTLLFPMNCIFLFSVEILHTRKTRKSFHARRLMSRIAFAGTFLSLGLLSVNISHFFLSPFIPSIYTFAIASFVAIWIVYRILKIRRFRRIFDRLTGKW